MGSACEFQVSLKFHMIDPVLLHEIERSSGSSEVLISYGQFLLTIELYKHDLLGFVCEFWASSKFYKIVLVRIHEIERTSSSPALLGSYKQFLLTFQLHDQGLLGFACEFRVSSKFYMIALVLVHEDERSFGFWLLINIYKQLLLTYGTLNEPRTCTWIPANQDCIAKMLMKMFLIIGKRP